MLRPILCEKISTTKSLILNLNDSIYAIISRIFLARLQTVIPTQVDNEISGMTLVCSGAYSTC